MATNIEQIFRSFVVNKFKEIQEEGKLDSENSENSQNGELTVQKEESTSESTAVCLQSEGIAPTCQDETMKTENLELAKPVTIAVETDSASKELKSAELTSDDEVKRDSSKKKSKKHKKHKSKKKKKKKKKEKHEKRSKSVSSVENQENVSSETKSVWKPAFSSPPKEQVILDALSNTESTNTVVLSSVNTHSIQSALKDKPTGLQLDVDSGFFGPKCPNELSKNVSSNSVICDAEIKEQCEASALATQQSNESTVDIEKTSEFAKTQQSGLSQAVCSQAKSPGVNSPLDVNSGKDSIYPSNRCGSLSNCEILQKSKEKSRSRSRSLENVPKSLETSTTSPKSRQRSYSISRDQRKQSRSSSAGQRQRSTSRSPARRQRSRSGTSRYSKSPIRNWWSKSIRNRRRSVSMVKKPGSRTRSPARRRKSRSRSAEKRHCSRTRSRSPSRQRKSRSISRKYRQRSKSASNKRTRSKSAKRRQSKSGSVSRIRRSRSYSGSRRRKSRSGSVVRRQRSWSVAGRRRRSMSGSAARRQRSRSASAIKRHKSRSVSPARRRRSRSASHARRRSRSASPGKRWRSRLASPARRLSSRSASPARRRRSRSASPARRRRSRSASPARRRRSRSASPARRRRSRSASPARRRRSRSASLARRRRSRSASLARRRRSRSASPARRRRSRSASPARRRRSRSASLARRRRSRSASLARRRRSRSASPARRRRSPSPARRRRSRSPSPARRRRSTSASPARRQRSSSVSRKSKSMERHQRMSLSSAVKRQRSRSGSEARRRNTISTSAARKGSRSTSPSTTKKPSQSKTGNKSRSRSGSVKIKGRSRSIEKTHKSRSRSSSKGRIPGLAPLNTRPPSTSPTVSQTKTSSSSETISDQSKLTRITPEPLCNDETLSLEKTETPVKLMESSSINAPLGVDPIVDSGSYSVSAVSNQEMFDSSFKAPASNMSCSPIESIAPQKDDINKTDEEMLTTTNISVEPYKPEDEASLDCTKTNYEKLQSSPDESEVLNDSVIQSSPKISTRFAGELGDEIQKPDILSVVEHESANTGSEREETCTTKHKESYDVVETTTCDQYSTDKELEFANQALHSDCTSLEPESNLSYLNSANNPYSCVKALSPSPAEAVQYSDRKQFESSNYQISNDDGFKKLDSVISPSVSTVSCIDAVPEYSSTLDMQDTSMSHSGKSNIDLNLLHASVHHASLTSHITSDAEEKPNPFLATNTTSLKSAFNQSEIPIKTLKGHVSDCYSQVDTNCTSEHKDESTPNFGLSSRDEVVLQDSTDTTHATLFADQSCSIMSEQTCSEKTTENIAYGNTTENLLAENDFASQRQIDQNLTSMYDEADLTSEEMKQSSENSIEAEMHDINQKHPEVELTQAETPISQTHLGEELSVFPQKTQPDDMFSNSQDQADVIFQESRKSPDSHVFRSFTDGTSSSRPVLEPVEHCGLDQSLYSSSENAEYEPVAAAAAAVIYALPYTAESGKELHENSQNCNVISESIKIEKSCPSNNEIHFNDDSNKVDSLPASDDAKASTISVGFQDLECVVSNEENQNLKCEAKQKSGSSEPSKETGPEITETFSPGEIASRKQQMFIQITDTLSKTIVEQTDGEISSLNEPYSILFSNNNNQNLDNIAKSATTNKNEDCKDHGPTTLLSIESKDDKMLTERQFGLEREADDCSQKKTASPYTAMNAASLCVKQNSASETDDKLGTEVESKTADPVSKLDNKVDLAADVEAKTRNYGQIEYAPYTESLFVCLNSSQVQKIPTSVVPEVQKLPTAMPVQFKFSKTFKTLASSQLCNTSDESSDKEISKVSSLSLSAKASVSSYVESSRTNAKSPQNVVQLKQRDTPLLPEALPPESLSNVGPDGKDALQQDVIQTDESSAAVKPTFPHISNALSKLGVKQRQYRSRSVAQDSRSPSVDRRQTSRSRSKSTARKRRSRSKSVSRKKRSQSSSRKKSSHSKSAKNKRSRSKSRGRKRRSQSKSKSKKKHSPSKSSGKRKRSCSKSSERVRSVGKAESSRSKSKTRRKGAHTKSPNSSRRSRSKSTVRKRSRSKNFDVRKTSHSKSGSSRSRSRSISLSRKHLSHSKLSLHRKHSRSSSKSTSPRKRSLSRNQGRSLSRSPARRHRSRSKSHTRRHRSRSRGRWRRSLSSSRKHSRSSSRTSGTFSTKQRRRSVSKSPTRGHRSRSQAKLKEKSPATKRKSISPLPQKKTIQSKAAPFKHSIGLKSLIQKQLSQAKSQGSAGKLSKEQLPLSTIAARAQLPATNFSARAQVSAPSLNIVSQISVPNLAEVPLPSENNNGQIPVPSVPPEQQMSVTSLTTEASLPVPDLTTATPWHVPDMAGGAQWPVPDIAVGTQWSMSDLTAGAQWPMADLAAGSHWPMHDLGVGTQWPVPDLAAGTPWAVPDVATGAQWTVPDLTASAQWTVPDLTAGSQWAMTNLAHGAQWTVPDLAPAAQWTVPDLTSGTHIQSADLASEAQVPGSDVASEAQVPGSDLATEAQVPGSDLTAEAQVPRSDLVSEAQVPVPDHVPDTFDNPVVEGHNLMPDVTAEALVPVASGTLVPDVAAGIPLPDVTVATQAPVPDVAATACIPVPDVATTAHGYMSDYVSYSTAHESVFENTAKPPVYLDMTLTAGELADSSFVTESLVFTKTLEPEAFNRTENQTAFESMPSTEHCLPNELPLIHGAVPEISASVSQKEIPVSSECQFKSEYCNVSNAPLFDPRLNPEDSSLIESTAEKGSSAVSILFESHGNSDCQLPVSVTDNTSVNNLHADSSPSQLHESCPSPMQSYISPNHTTLVDPYHSPDNLLIEPYSSPDRPILVTEYCKSDCQLLSEPNAVSDCSVLAACVSSEHSPIVRATSSYDHSHQELSEHKVSLDDLQQQEASTALPCPESADYFANYPEQVNTCVSPSCEISGDKSADPDIPQLVEPYGSPEHPQIVEPYASPEQPQLVEPYASPECLQLVEPYASPEHPLLVEPYGSPDSQELVESDVGQELPQVVESLVSPESAETVQSYASLQSPQLSQPDDPQLDQPFANPGQTQLVQQNSSSESFTDLESSHVLQSCANLDGPQLVQPYTNSEQNMAHPFVNSKPIQLEPDANSEHPQVIQSYTIPECPQVVQSFASTDCPQLVQPYDSPEHPQLLQPYDTPEHPQLVESYGSPEHHQQDQPSESPKHQQLVLPYDSMESSQLVQPYTTPECSQLDQPYSSPKHSQLDQPHARPEHLQLDEPYASPNRSQPKQPHASPKLKQLAQPYTSPEHPQLVQPEDSQEHRQLVQPYDSPEHMQLVQPCASTEHPLLVESYASPEHSQLIEPYSSVDHPQLEETYSSPYHNQRDEINSSPVLSLNLESSCHDIDENCKLAQSPLPDSRFDPLLDKFDNTTGPSLEVACPSLLQKHKNSPELSQPILEECCESSYKISEELYDTAPESLCGDSSECPVHTVSKEDYIDSDQYLECYNSDSTQLDRSTSSSQLEPDQSSNHQRAIEKSLLDKRQLELEVQYARDDQQLEKKLSPVEECIISNQPQIFSEHTNSEEDSPSITCLNKDCFSTDQVLSVDLINVAGQTLDEEINSSTDPLLKDTCLDLPHVAYPQVNLTLEDQEQPSMPLLDKVISNAEVSLTDGTMSILDTDVEDRAVPSVEQEERSDRFEGDKNLSTTEQSLTDETTVIFQCDPPDSLIAQSEILSDKAYPSCFHNLPQNIPLDGYRYPPSENKPHSPSPHSPLEEQPFISAKEITLWNACEHPGLKADCSKSGQILSNPEIDDLSEPDETTVESSKSDMKSNPLSSQQICNLPLATILPAETDEPSTNLSLQTQDKVDSFVSVQASVFPVEFETHMVEDSGDNVQIDQEFKITPPDLLPFDSEQPTSLCLNSESSSEPVLFISQPPPKLLPYDSEQPANSFQNISDYSSEQDSLVFHTPPELLPYDSDQATMLVSKPESCDEKLSLCEPTDESEKSSAVFVPFENPSVSQGSLTSVEETIKVQPSSVGATDTSIISTKELVCVEEYETSRSSNILLQASDLPNSEMLVEQPAATFLNAESGQELPSSQSSCHETKHVLEQPFLDEITTPQPLSQREHSVELSPLITEDSIEHSQVTVESVKSAPSVSTAEIEQASLILNTCETSVVEPCSGNSELMNFSEQKKATVTQSHVAGKVSNKRSRSKSLSKTELAHSLSTSTKCDSPSKHASRPARSHSRSKDRKKSRSKSKTRKKRSRSKSVTRIKKSRSKSVVKPRKSRSRSRSLSRKRRSRSTSVAHKKSSRSPPAAHRRRSRSSRRKRSTSVDHKRAHSHSVARRRHSRSRSPVRRRRSRSSSLHRRKRSRSSSVARRRRSRSSSITRRRRSRSSSVSRRRHSPSQSATRRRTSPSLGRRRRSRSPSLAHRRRSASHRRRSRSPSASRRRLSPSAPHRRRSRTPSSLRRKRSSSATRKRNSRSSSASRKRRSRSSSTSRKRHSRTPTVACKKRSESKSPTPKSPKTKQRAQSKSDRSRSRSQSNIIRKRKTRSRSSSRDISKSNEKRRKRSSSKDHYSTKQRRKSRTPPRRKKSRSPVRRVSPCRSPVRRRRSRSPVRRKSFSRSPVRRKRSRSRDQSMDSARSPKRLTDLDKAQLLEIAKANAAAMCAKSGMPLPPSLKPVLTPSAPVDEKVTHRTYGVTIQELTEKCKQIAQSKEDDEVVNKPHDSDEEEDDKPFYNHPFKVSEHKPISFSLLNPSLKPAPKTQVTLTKEFPVSSGSQHRKKESDKVYGEWVPVDKKTEESKDDVFTNTGPSQPVDITAAMNERAMAQTRLTGNPFDLEALLMLNRAQEQIDAWAQSTSLPGQFTGSTGAQVLSADEISNSGPQAWLKKDQFLKAAPVSGGRGALLMRKMGWKEGEGLGRNNEGNVNPILVDFKTDRKGLVADGEKASNKLTMPVIKDLSGKHPISVLMELCNKKKWSPPDFMLIDDTGPDHRKRFLFRVTVNAVTCQPSQPSVTKKLAKATAAAAALQALGALPKENITSTTNFCSASTSTL